MIIGNWITMRTRWSTTGEADVLGVPAWDPDPVNSLSRSDIVVSASGGGALGSTRGMELDVGGGAGIDIGSGVNEWYLSQPHGWLTLEHTTGTHTNARLKLNSTGTEALGLELAEPGDLLGGDEIPAETIRQIFRNVWLYVRAEGDPGSPIYVLDCAAAFEGDSYDGGVIVDG